MSRGRGRGGGFGGGRGKTAQGAEIPYHQDLHITDRPQPTGLFPPYKVVTPKPLTQDEKTQVAHFLSLRKRIHDGPLYTVLGESSKIGKNDGRANTAAARFDPFEGMPTYSQRYTRKKRRIPKLDTRPYVLKYFPKELWSTLDPSHETTNVSESNAKLKPSVEVKSKKLNGISAYDINISSDSGPVDRVQDGEDDDELPEKVDEDEIPPEEEADDEYASDEDEMAGDYNAEQYFDDGGDDAGDDYDAGEADGGEYD